MARREFPTVLELVGHTPIVRLERLGRDVPGELLAKLEYLNPGGSVKDRIGLAMVEAAEQDGRLRPGRDDRRADLGEHGSRARDRGCAARLPLHLRHAGQDEPGEDLDAARVRRRGRDHADCGRPALAGELLRRVGPPRRGDPRRLQARPVLESVEPRGALRHDRARAVGADRRRRRRRDRHLRRDGRHDHGRRPLLQGARLEGAHRRGRSRGLGLHRRRGASRWVRTSSRGSARSGGRTRSTRRSSTSGCASRTATRSSPLGGSRARRVCSWAARPARPRGRESRSRSASAPRRAS